MNGIYMFTNKKNDKKYIGQSERIEERYNQHRRNYKNPNLDVYNTHFYRALRKHGFENFGFKVLYQGSSIDRNYLNELEKYFVSKYDSYKGGYNMNFGGEYTSSVKTLNEEEVLIIKDMLINTDDFLVDIAKKFDVTGGLIGMINKGFIWKSVGSRDFPLREQTNSLQGCGGRNPNAKISDERAMYLREEFTTKTLNKVYSENNNLLSFSGMKKLLYGVTFQHLPVYKKRKKEWYLNGICIDYPRLEE